MAFNANDKPKQPQQELIDEGLYPARLARIIELGDQEDKYGIKSKVVLGFTVPSEKITIEGEEKQRMMLTFPLNKTSNPDATLMKYMKALNGATWDDVINKPCMIEISHKTVNGIPRMNITNVVKPMNGVPVDEPDCDVHIFDFDNPDKDVYEKLSDFRKDQIKQAVNYEGSAVQEMLEGSASAGSAGQADEEGEDSPI